jgi:phosphatidylserine/phosphatidylglycerophosphate/cardiolipin synthase-like enzyme
VEGLAAAMESWDATAPSAAYGGIEGVVPQPHYRALAIQLVDTWRRRAPHLKAEGLALALVTAAHCEETTRRGQSLELVWTGPDVEAIPPRRTEQALLQVINTASSRLTIVSFVAYKIPAIRDALSAAADRGVTVRLILEGADVSEGQMTFRALRAFGRTLADRSTVYVWPREKRSTDGKGNHGSLHAKCAVADGNCLFLSSANLTEHAFQLNLELGILVTGGPLPARVESYWESLIRSKILTAAGP